MVERAGSVIPAEADIDRAPGLLAGAASLGLTPQMRNLEYWLGAVAQGTRRGLTSGGHSVAEEKATRALDSGPAEPWAYGLVGFVAAAGDWWMSHGRPISRAALTDYVVTLIWQGWEGIAATADIPGGFLEEEAGHDR